MILFIKIGDRTYMEVEMANESVTAFLDLLSKATYLDLNGYGESEAYVRRELPSIILGGAPGDAKYFKTAQEYVDFVEELKAKKAEKEKNNVVDIS